MDWINLKTYGLPKITEPFKEYFIINSNGSFDITTFRQDLEEFNNEPGFYNNEVDSKGNTSGFVLVNDWVDFYYPCDYPDSFPID